MGLMIDIQPATERDAAFIRAVHYGDCHSLGFIPLPRLLEEAHRGRVLVCRNNADEVGYVYYSSAHGNMRRVFQIAVRKDARMIQHGRLLLEAVPATQILARCAENIEGLGFWDGVGGERVAVSAPNNTRKRRIITFQVGNEGGLL